MKKHLRDELGKYWVSLVRKDKCEKCGETNSLHLHHNSYKFQEIVIETFKELCIPYTPNKNELSKEQIRNITNIVLGKHLRIKTETLCEECHKIEHYKESYKAMRNDISKIIIPLNFLNRPLTREDKVELCEYLDYRNENNRLIKWKGIKKYIIDNNLYKVTPFNTRKLSDDGTQIRTDIIEKM